MTVTTLEPPTWPLVNVDAAQDYLKVDDPEDAGDIAVIQGICLTVSEEIDGVGGDLGHAFGVQTLRATFPGFPAGDLEIPYPPLREVVSVTYLDPAGTVQTLPQEAYETAQTGDFSVIRPVFGTNFPHTACHPEAVRVEFEAGYDQLPSRARQAMLLRIGDLYRNRGDAAFSSLNLLETPAIARLLRRFRADVIR